jgi:hypothetical protein
LADNPYNVVRVSLSWDTVIALGFLVPSQRVIPLRCDTSRRKTMTTVECKAGDRVRLKLDLPVAAAGTEGTVQRLVYDGKKQVTAVDILLDLGAGDKRGTTVFPQEIEKV